MTYRSLTFALCETGNHIQYISAQEPRATIVPLTPEALWFCQQNKITYQQLDDFVSNSKLTDFGEKALRLEYEWARWMDDQLSQLIPAFRIPGFSPARANLYFLKRSFDNFLLPASVLKEFVINSHAEELIVFERPPFVPGFDTVVAERPLFALVAPILKWQAHVTVQQNISTPLKVSTSSTRLWQRILRQPKNLANRILKYAQYVFRNPTQSSRRAAWVGSDYDMVFAVPHLQQQGIAVIRPPRSVLYPVPIDTGQSIAMMLAETWHVISRQAEFWQVLDEVDPGLRSVAEPFLRHWWCHELPKWSKQFEVARDWLQQENLAVVFGTEVQSVATSALFSAAASLKIPRIAALHNGPGGAADLPVQDCLGMIQSDVYLVGGEADVDYFQGFNKRLGIFPRAKAVPVGLARLDDLRVRAPSNADLMAQRKSLGNISNPLILHIPTALIGCYMYFNEGYLSDNAYFELQQRILKCYADFPQVSVLFKPFPVHHAINPIETFIAQEIPNMRVTQTALTDLMWVVDAIVIDFPSTALNEILVTDKPILSYCGHEWARLLPQADVALCKRVSVAETPDEYESLLREFLTQGNFTSIKNPDNEFLRLYGTYLDDGKSAERAAQVIAQIATRNVHSL